MVWIYSLEHFLHRQWKVRVFHKKKGRCFFNSSCLDLISHPMTKTRIIHQMWILVTMIEISLPRLFYSLVWESEKVQDKNIKQKKKKKKKKDHKICIICGLTSCNCNFGCDFGFFLLFFCDDRREFPT